AADQPDFGFGSIRGPGTGRTVTTGSASVAPPDADDLPGSVRVPESAQAGRADRRGPTGTARYCQWHRVEAAGAGAPRPGGPAGRALQSLSARILGWPAS